SRSGVRRRACCRPCDSRGCLDPIHGGSWLEVCTECRPKHRPTARLRMERSWAGAVGIPDRVNRSGIRRPCLKERTSSYPLDRGSLGYLGDSTMGGGGTTYFERFRHMKTYSSHLLRDAFAGVA